MHPRPTKLCMHPMCTQPSKLCNRPTKNCISNLQKYVHPSY